MASVTTNDILSIATGTNGRDSTRVILAQYRSLDLLAMSTLLLSTPGLELVGAEVSLQKLVESSRVLRPEVAIIDAMYPEGAAFEAASDLIENKYTRCVLFLDDIATTCHEEQAVEIPNTGYLAKEASMEELCKAIEKLSARALSPQKNRKNFDILSA